MNGNGFSCEIRVLEVLVMWRKSRTRRRHLVVLFGIEIFPMTPRFTENRSARPGLLACSTSL